MLERLERELMLVSRRQLMGRPDAERLERSAYVLLRRIEAEGPMSIRQLTEAFGLDASTVNRQTAAMLRCGLVDRIPDDCGGQARKLRITDTGARRLAEDREHYQRKIARMVEDWSAEDVDRFTELLTRFNRGAEEFDGRHWPRED